MQITQMQTELDILKHKLKGFIRKFYQNLIIRGVIISISLLIVFVLSVNLVEYYLWSDTITRTILFYGFLAISLFVLAHYIAIPVIKLLQMGKVLTNKEAARIIGNHFHRAG